MRVLHVFDFDDTLVHSDSNVRIVHGDGTKSSLSSQQYATYDEQPDDIMDFSDFEKYPSNPSIIDSVFSELERAIIKDGLSSVVILTARSNPEPVRLFLEDNGISGLEIHATGSSDPRKKAEYVLQKIKSEDLDFVKVFEDNAKNIRAIRKYVRADGSTALQTHRVSNGKIVSVNKIIGNNSES